MVCAIWHDELFPLVFLHRKENVVAVVSQSRDGDLLSRVLQGQGIHLARGSSSRGGVKALVSSIRQVLDDHRDAVITVDGPRGPRHRTKDGAIYLAMKTGALIVPVRVKMSRTKVFLKAWDRFQLPWPFSTCIVFYGTPYQLKKDMTALEIEEQREVLQTKLDQLLPEAL